MILDLVASADAPTSARRSWRITTAVRVFAIALVVGRAVSADGVGQVATLVVALGLLAALASLVERVGVESQHRWVPVVEAMLVAAVVGSEPTRDEAILLYLAVPPLVAGIRLGWLSATNAFLVSTAALVIGSRVSADPPSMDVLQSAGFWLLTGLGVGVLAGVQTRSIRDLEQRQAPYVATHQLMSQLHDLASRGEVGLDSVKLATELAGRLRDGTGATGVAVYGHAWGQPLVQLAGHGDTSSLASHALGANHEHKSDVLVIGLRGAGHQLGSVVLKRTEGWPDAVRGVAQTVADEFALRLDTAVLFDEVRRLATAEERKRIAREMHDGVAQELAALGYIVDEIASVSEEDETVALADSLRDEISRIVAEIRYSILDLRHHVADHRLSGALADYVHQVTQDMDVRVNLVLDESGPALPPRTETELLRVAQEAIGNVRKHARAENLWVTLVSDGTTLLLEVEDDGIGNARPKERHWGLQSMQERAAGIEASLEVTPREGGGTVVRLHSPPTTPPATATKEYA
ncbi:signal transduction histidine kinase [Nocardioides cavernae]|uniref:histidine kinase n=1 Tax=Nocardioides cavernae TaxID=1921566 RepID=A0A7Y9KVI1_9ACTN|nr:histidine kinase [Nocardioides cavernae]NYE38908.1 signal transduction histidine kinase [Nocardioides cavernae]